MIKILSLQYKDNFEFELAFSNGEHGIFDVSDYIAKRTGILLEPLRNIDYCKRCFIDAGALCWPNGLELSGSRVFELSHVVQIA